jgi:hypothetical protein
MQGLVYMTTVCLTAVLSSDSCRGVTDLPYSTWAMVPKVCTHLDLVEAASCYAYPRYGCV